MSERDAFLLIHCHSKDLPALRKAIHDLDIDESDCPHPEGRQLPHTNHYRELMALHTVTQNEIKEQKRLAPLRRVGVGCADCHTVKLEPKISEGQHRTSIRSLAWDAGWRIEDGKLLCPGHVTQEHDDPFGFSAFDPDVVRIFKHQRVTLYLDDSTF